MRVPSCETCAHSHELTTSSPRLGFATRTICIRPPYTPDNGPSVTFEIREGRCGAKRKFWTAKQETIHAEARETG